MCATLMTASCLLRYVRVHRIWVALIAVVATAAISAFLGGFQIPLPSFEGGPAVAGVPFRRELPLFSAVLIASSLGGPMADHEGTGGVLLHRTRLVVTSSLLIVSCALSFLSEAAAAGVGSGVVFVRSLLIWLGLAFLSGRLFGVRLTWIVPLLSVFPLVWLGTGKRWDWTAMPASDPASWWVAGLSLAIGASVLWVTSWRIYEARAISLTQLRSRNRVGKGAEATHLHQATGSAEDCRTLRRSADR